MIITKLTGGLGNQMFQYATGRAVALESGTNLKLDITNFDDEGYPRRKYMLNRFSIEEDFATPEEIRQLRTKKFFSLRPGTYVSETSTHGKILVEKNDLYLDGYWQSEDYFKSNEKIIKKDFTIKASPSKVSLLWLKKIKKSPSVAVHVRRTDYVNRGSRKPIIGCSIDYYFRASTLLASKLKTKPTFFVFSDDLSWCKENIFFRGYETNYISGDELEDLRLISSCDHSIIANSSFSWWGAWLNTYPTKIVIAPDPWLENSINHYHDYVPSSWSKIPKA